MLLYFTHASIVLAFSSLLTIMGIFFYWERKTEGFGAMANGLGLMFTSVIFIVLLAVYLLTLFTRVRVLYFQIVLLVLTAGFVYFSFDPRELAHLRIWSILFSVFGISALIATWFGGFRK